MCNLAFSEIFLHNGLWNYSTLVRRLELADEGEPVRTEIKVIVKDCQGRLDIRGDVKQGEKDRQRVL